MIVRQLEKLGLSEGEAKTYLAALELGETTVARIAKKAEMKRTTAYEFVEGLRRQGLITVGRQGKRAVYIAEDPKKLRAQAEERTKLVEELIPGLLAMANVIDRKPTVRYFENQEGIYDIYRETLSFPDQAISMWMSDVGVWYDDLSFWTDYYIPSRMEKKISLRAILPETEKTRAFHEGDAKSLRQTRLDRGGGIDSDIMLYGGRFAAFISSDEMIGLVVESRKIYSTLRHVFEAQWKSLGE